MRVAVLSLGGVLLLAAPLPVRGGAELLLADGTVVAGTSVERRDGLFVLELEKGGSVAIPADLVKELRLTGADDPAPSGIRKTEPRNLSGPTITPPGRREQLAAFGRPPAVFRGNPVDSRWRPTSAWPEGEDQSNFNPTQWYRSPTDPNWSPVPALKASKDVTEFHPVRWYRPPTNPVWQPRDAFAPRVWFPEVANPPE